ncbi:MAG: MarR family winged helix-turn-helix transcriptional regulator [bacterium]|nr:MarR family winged helix-turn-helix transcriptional regulator [bacterium]
MGEGLNNRLKQYSFSSPYHEALLSILVCQDFLTRQMDEACIVHGITAAQYNVLRILRGVYPEGHSRAEIIKRMIHAAPDVTRLIDRIVKVGYASRGRSKEDGRLSLTYITQKGLNLLATMQADIDNLELDIRSRLDVSEAETLTRLCDKLLTTNE